MTRGAESRLGRLECQRKAGTPSGDAVELPVPHIGEFALLERFLGQRLYPRQLLILKLMFCALDLLTDYDRAVLAEWSAGFTPIMRSDGSAGFAGTYGVPPDVLDRMQWCRNQGRGWFREIVAVIGRRGSKGLLGAIASAYVLWRLLATGDPQANYGLPAGKQLHVLVFAGKHDQAKANQFKDIVDCIENAPCFQSYLAGRTADTLLLFSPAQVAAGVTDPARAAIVIRAAESTPLSGRGPASPLLLFDEMAHMTSAGSNRSAEEMYSAATPATSQFGTEALIYQASSPWQQQGQFYFNYQRGLALDADTSAPIDPDVLVVQLPSWDLYRDWELTAGEGLAAWPDGPVLPVQKGPMFDRDDAGAAQRRADPANFDVEYRAQWATSMAAYLRPGDVDLVFSPWRGQALEMRGAGSLWHPYVAHGDPSRVNANFAFVIAHPEIDELGHRHVIVDLIHTWRPADFDNHTINYRAVTADIKKFMIDFPLSSVSFDQFNSAGLLDELQHFARTEPRLQRRPTLRERPATTQRNLRDAEVFKSAVIGGRVHAPFHDLADRELRNLEERNGRVDHPSRGPVQTSDVADALMAVTAELLGDGAGHLVMQALSSLSPRGTGPRGPWTPSTDGMAEQFSAFSRAKRRQVPHNPARGRRPGTRY